MQKSFLPTPIERHIKLLAQNSHLIKSGGQFLSLLEAAEIDQHTPLPALTARTTLIREWECEDYVHANLMLTIWDIFPGIDACTTQAEAHDLGVLLSSAYIGDLKEILDLLFSEEAEDAGYYYTQVDERLYTPRFKWELFKQRSQYKNHPFGTRLLGSTVIVTISAPMECVKCDPSFTPEFVKQCLNKRTVE